MQTCCCSMQAARAILGTPHLSKPGACCLRSKEHNDRARHRPIRRRKAHPSTKRRSKRTTWQRSLFPVSCTLTACTSFMAFKRKQSVHHFRQPRLTPGLARW